MYVYFDYKMKTPSRTMRVREYHATEVILIGNVNPSKKWADDVSAKKASIRLYFFGCVSAGMALPSKTKIEPDRRLKRP